MKKLLQTLGIIGGLASIVGVYLIFNPPKSNASLLIEFDNEEKLVENENYGDPDLKQIYIYKKDTIQNLFRRTINISNSSSVTLVSSGPQQNIIDSTIHVEIDPKIQVVKAIVTNRTFNIEPKLLPNKFSLKFSQWRPSENLTMSIYYIKTQDSIDDFCFFQQPETRPIINGDIICRLKQPIVENSKISIIPKSILKGSRYFAAFILLTVALIAIFQFIRNFWYSGEIRKWHSKYDTKWNDFVVETYGNKCVGITKPHLLREEEWSKFDGEKYPKKGKSTLFKNNWEVFFTFLGLLIVTLLLVPAGLYLLLN